MSQIRWRMPEDKTTEILADLWHPTSDLDI